MSLEILTLLSTVELHKFKQNRHPVKRMSVYCFLFISDNYSRLEAKIDLRIAPIENFPPYTGIMLAFP